jgi:hypothetical protein
MKAFCSYLLLLLLLVPAASWAQDEPQHSPFGCSNHAVQLDIKQNPALKFAPLQGLPQEAINSNPQHTFRFLYAGPFTFVTVQLAATIGEQLAGRGMPAKLGVYVQTKQDGFPQSPMQFWQLVSTASQTSYPQRTSERLAFDSNRVAECFKNEDAQCEFAAIKLATPDPNIPLLDLSFMEDLGGANAGNQQEAHILMDFRSSPPQVLATADCAYNEGGGACTAIDSGMASRSDLQCDWMKDRSDFLCSEINDPEGSAHRDFYLLSHAEPPPRNEEVATLGEAVKGLRAHPEKTIKVRGVGAIGWVSELNLSAREKVILLGSQILDGGARFYSIPESQDGLGTPVVLLPHDFGEHSEPSMATLDQQDWTVDQAASFTSRSVYDDPSLSVVQVVAKSKSNRLYWIGVEKASASPEFDVVELAGGSKYSSCGQYDVQASVIAVKNIERPFRAVLQIQPPTVTSEGEDQPIAWNDSNNGSKSSEDETVTGCLRTGELHWAGGRFQSAINEAVCQHPEKPGYVQVDDAGKVKLSYQSERE